MPFYLIFKIGCVALAVFLAVRNLRHLLERRRSRTWPITQATIDRGEAKFHKPFLNLFSGNAPTSLIEYSYSVENNHYVGYFVIVRSLDLAKASNILGELNGKLLNVRFDPEHPKRSVVVDREVLGKAIHQGPDWLPRSLDPLRFS
jgi:hypothetical protein